MTGMMIFIRSLAIQALWNYRKMQNTGFFFALYPCFTGMHDKGRWSVLTARHLGFFNTHPYMASGIAGIVAHMELTAAAGGSDAGELIGQVKQHASGLCAAAGDRFFWGALRPFLLMTAVTLFYLIGDSKGAVFSVIIFLTLYNTAHLYVRYGFFHAGFSRGLAGMDFIAGLRLVERSAVIEKTMPWVAAVYLVAAGGGVTWRASAFVILAVLAGRLVDKIGVGALIYISAAVITVIRWVW